jgi:mannose-6-phosphate isomerase
MTKSLDLSSLFRVLPDFKERIWGKPDLKAWFSDAPHKTIGEAWFTAQESKTAEGTRLQDLLLAAPQILGNAGDPAHPGLCPLLVKLLFTTSRLSVQVHPKDEYAQRHHNSLGKTEAWFVVDAEPGATVALGFRDQISPERLRSSAVSGEIEDLLDWRPVQAGDMIFVPAGTVHAIGAGLTICEIQENSDITYRLYDYGRARELHLDHACAVSDLGPYRPQNVERDLAPGRTVLAECGYFRIEHLQQKGAKIELAGGLLHYTLLISTKGRGSIAGQPFERAQVWVVPANAKAVVIENGEAEWLMTYLGTQPPPNVKIG